MRPLARPPAITASRSAPTAPWSTTCTPNRSSRPRRSSRGRPGAGRAATGPRCPEARGRSSTPAASVTSRRTFRAGRCPTTRSSTSSRHSSSGRVVKLMLRHDRLSADALLSVAREVGGHLAEFSHSNSADGLLEISAAGVSKATALARFCERARHRRRGRDRVRRHAERPADAAMGRLRGGGRQRPPRCDRRRRRGHRIERGGGRRPRARAAVQLAVRLTSGW